MFLHTLKKIRKVNRAAGTDAKELLINNLLTVPNFVSGFGRSFCNGLFLAGL